jgi:hypothetical protein
MYLLHTSGAVVLATLWPERGKKLCTAVDGDSKVNVQLVWTPSISRSPLDQSSWRKGLGQEHKFG